MRYSQFLTEYDRARALQALGPNFFLAALRDKIRLWHVPLNRLEADLRSRNSASVGWFNDPAAQQELVDTYMEQIENTDPTLNKKYTQWLARQFMTSPVLKLEDLTSTLADYLAKFDKLNRKRQIESPFNDINRYKNVHMFMDKMDEYEDPVDDNNRGKARTVFDGETVKVVIPEDEAAACTYGRQTRWCTAATQGTNYFEHYNRQGPLYILLPKTPEHQGEKYQLHFPSSQFMDEDDSEVSIKKILTERFPELLEFFLSQEKAYLGNYLMFAPDSVLEPLSEQINSLLMDFLNELASEWEVNDDYYYSWLRDEGYIDSETDEVSDDAPSYFDYNDEAKQEYDKMEEAIVLSPDTIRELAEELGDRDNYVVETESIEDVYKFSVKEKFGRDYGMGDEMIGFIKKRLYVTYDHKTDQWTATLTKIR
jgi:hypothetical protein